MRQLRALRSWGCSAPRLSRLAAAACCTAAALSALSPAAAGDRPNILFIFTDDQPSKTIGCCPESPDWVRTPHIDRLAAEGVRFERAYLGAWCMPSRASVLTGRLQHGIESMRMEGRYPGSVYDPEVCPFVPREFRRQGYHTAHIGKWHTGTDPGLGRDWDHQIVWNRPKLPANAGAYYSGQILSFNGVEQPTEGYSTDVYTDLAVDYIRGGDRPADKPWLLWLCYGAVHGPTTPAERHRGTLADRDVDIPADIFGPWPDKPAYLVRTSAWTPGPDGRPMLRRRGKKTGGFDTDTPGKSHAALVRQFHECTLALDEGVGRLIAALEETGQLANTLVVYTTDQGYAVGEHGCNSKLAPYDATIASPLIFSWPGRLPTGEVRRQPVNSPDLTATLCRLAGVEIPWPLHGREFTRLLEPGADEVTVPPMLLTHTGRIYGSDTATIPAGEAIYEQAGVPWWVLLRDGRHKYVRSLVPGEIEEVYDLEADPEELANLAADPAHGQLVARLRQAAVAELERTAAPFVGTLPPVRGIEAGPASLEPPRQVEPPTPEQAVTNRGFQGIPSLAIAPGGRLWATWYAGVTPAEDLNNYVVVATSGDGGGTWDEVLVIDPDGPGPVRSFDPELWVAPDGRLFCFWAQMDKNVRDTSLGVWAIETAEPDAVRPAWSAPRRIGDGVMMCKPIVLSTGEWVLPVSRWSTHDESAELIVSTDAGQTWSRRGACNVPEKERSFDEHMFVERQDGSLWLLARTTYGIGESISTDRGATWPELVPSALAHPSARFFIQRLASGNLLLVKHGPLETKTGRSDLMAFVSTDDGLTWGGGLLLDERKGVSYPDGQQAADGTVRIIYDYSRTGDREILMASFREEDAAAGKAVSDAVRLRQVVAKASGGRRPTKP
jgi:arylsulfatase A-like enzyme